MTAPILLALLFALAACKPPPDQRHFAVGGDVEAGREATRRAGCASCHDIPGIDWPRGTVGPGLAGFASGTLIAGRLPNRPDVLAAFVRDAQSLVPGSAMPPMPLDQREARDVAAFLYTLER